MEVLLAKKESQMALRPYNSLLTSTFSKDAGSVSPALDLVLNLDIPWSRANFLYGLERC